MKHGLGLTAWAVWLLFSGFMLHDWPVRTAPVTDAVQLFNDSQKNELTVMMQPLLKKKLDIGLLITDTVCCDAENFHSYCMKVYEQWHFGEKSDGMGILMVYATKVRGVNIIVGEGLWPVISKGDVQAIISQSIIPRMKAGKPYEGIKAGLDLVVKKVDNNIRILPGSNE
jgi:uncharacterized protein